MTLLLLFALAATLTTALLLLALPWLKGPNAEAARVLAMVHSEREDRRAIPWNEQLGNRVAALTAMLRKRFGMGENDRLRKRMQQAGLRHKSTLDLFFAAQALGVLLGASLGSFLPENTFFWVFTGAVVGYMAPDVWLTARGKSHRTTMRRSVPDTIDLLVICVDAGLGLDQALLRVREALSVSHPALNEELERLNYELLAGTPRPEAWRRLAERTKLDELASLATILAETDRFGTPIAKALNDFSEQLRLERRQHAEEAAARTKIKIIFPLVLCIFPCIFIVLLAPALLSIAEGMKSMGN